MIKKIITAFAILLLILGILLIIKNNNTKQSINYDLISIKKYSYVKYKIDENYGVIDRNGNIVIEAKYKDINIPNPEKDIFVCYENDEKPIVLNAQQQRLFQKYDSVEAIKLKNVANILCYEKSVLKYHKDGLYGIIDFQGNEITKNEYQVVENLEETEGKLLVKKDSKFGVININGVVLVEPKYDKIKTDSYYDIENTYLRSGFIVSNTTKDGYRYGYINYDGKMLLNVEYNNIIRIPEKSEAYLITAKEGKYGLYKGKNKIIESNYQSISYTDNGAIIIEKNKQFGIASIDGKINVEPKYNSIEERGIYLYAQNSKQNDVYNKNGEKVEINFNKTVYKTESEKYNISTFVNNDITYYTIENNDGKELTNNKYKYIEYLFKEYFLAEDENDKYGVINANGNIEIEFENDLIQKIKDKDILQASNYGDKNIKFYSSELKQVSSMKSARVHIKTEYVKIYNEDEEEYLDNQGNKLESDSEYIKNAQANELPDSIKDYDKFQYSLDDVYYTQYK